MVKIWKMLCALGFALNCNNIAFCKLSTGDQNGFCLKFMKIPSSRAGIIIMFDIKRIIGFPNLMKILQFNNYWKDITFHSNALVTYIWANSLIIIEPQFRHFTVTQLNYRNTTHHYLMNAISSLTKTHPRSLKTTN